MTLIEIACLVVAIVAVVVAWFLIPVIIELRKTLVVARETLGKVSDELHPTLLDLQQTAADLKVISDGIAGRIEEVETFMVAVGDTGRNIRTVNAAIGGVASLVGKSSVWMTGVRVTSSYLLERLLRKKRG